MTFIHAADRIGPWLGYVYGVYTVALLLFSLVGVHALVLVWTLVWLKRAPAMHHRVRHAVVDVIYGLVNPVFYLVVLTSAGPLWVRYPMTRSVLSASAWTSLAVIWAIRLLAPAQATVRGRRGIAALLWIGAVVLLAHGFFDLVTVLPRSGLTTFNSPADEKWLSVPGGLPSLIALYAIPLVRVATWLRVLHAPTPTQTGLPGFVMPAVMAKWSRGIAAFMILLAAASTAPRWSDRHATALVHRHRESILAAAQSYDVSPRALAAILWVTQRDQLSPLRDVVERLAVSVWQSDDTSHMATAGLSVSIGLMQIKPTTLQTAARIRDRSVDARTPAEQWGGGFKNMRDASVLGEEWRLPIASLRSFTSPFPALDKSGAVAALLDDRMAIHAAALILSLYRIQWEHANPAWTISHRPDILATLYQIGFERSRPHAQPKSNAFGRRAQQVYEEAWLQEAFPDTSSPTD